MSLKQRLLFVGMPGAGKSTQAGLLEARYDIKHISTGGITRKAFDEQDPLVMPYKEQVYRGKLLPDDVVFELIERELCKIDDARGYVFDGATRNLNQAKISLENGWIGQLFHFSLGASGAIRRIDKRHDEEGREEDSPEFVMERMRIYNQETYRILAYLRSHGLHVHTIDASPPIEEVHSQIKNILGLK